MADLVHARFYNFQHPDDGESRSADILLTDVDEAKEWVLEWTDTDEIDWFWDDKFECLRGIAAEGPQVGEIHERNVGEKFARF